MSAHFCLRASALQGWRILPRIKVLSPGCLCLLLLTGCTAAPPLPVGGAHPANYEAGVRPAAYRSVIGPYATQRPRDPGGWRENNQLVAPQEKP
jgi:hypothetical protein